MLKTEFNFFGVSLHYKKYMKRIEIQECIIKGIGERRDCDSMSNVI